MLKVMKVDPQFIADRVEDDNTGSAVASGSAFSRLPADDEHEAVEQMRSVMSAVVLELQCLRFATT
jgi:hypothetical protein